MTNEQLYMKKLAHSILELFTITLGRDYIEDNYAIDIGTLRIECSMPFVFNEAGAWTKKNTVIALGEILSRLGERGFESTHCIYTSLEGLRVCIDIELDGAVK